MPKKKSTAKKTTKTRAKSAIQKDIAKAVARIPQMIADQMDYTPPSRSTKPKTAEPIPTYRNAYPSKRALLWIGVGTITVAVFAMWIVNAKAMFYDIQHTKSTEGQLITDAKDDIGKILQSGPKKPVTPPPATTETNSADTSETVKQTLHAIFAGTATTTSSTVNTQNEIIQ